MMQILRMYDITEKLVTAINFMYQGKRVRVITPDGELKFFEKLAGVLQTATIHGREEELGFPIDWRKGHH